MGCQAGDRLYLSWGDAVKRARERYGIVMENYRMGRYDDHHRPMDGVLNAQGSMMDALAKLRDLGDGLAERYREGWDEHREGIQARGMSSGRNFRSAWKNTEKAGGPSARS